MLSSPIMSFLFVFVLWVPLWPTPTQLGSPCCFRYRAAGATLLGALGGGLLARVASLAPIRCCQSGCRLLVAWLGSQVYSNKETTLVNTWQLVTQTCVSDRWQGLLVSSALARHGRTALLLYSRRSACQTEGMRYRGASDTAILEIAKSPKS